MSDRLLLACLQDEVASYLPLSTFGVLCVVSALLVPILPETKNRPLPETLEDAENIARRLPVTSKPNIPTGSGTLYRHVQTATEDLEQEDAV